MVEMGHLDDALAEATQTRRRCAFCCRRIAPDQPTDVIYGMVVHRSCQDPETPEPTD